VGSGVTSPTVKIPNCMGCPVMTRPQLQQRMGF
jgi:hypothetical protein